MATDSSDSFVSSHEHDEAAEFETLLGHAKQGDTDALGALLQWYVNYLTILASTGLNPQLRRRVNPSDVVQEAMLAAHRDFNAFRGQSQNELLAWLRQILINTLHRNFARHMKAEKRDVRREVSLDAMTNRLEESACNLAALLPGEVDSPSSAMRANESAVEMADQLSKLQPQYRDVIVYRVLQGLAFDEIAKRMDRSSGAVRMLWLRGLEAFRIQSEGMNER
jgi:RNA polymerase sigma-70 factor (ECF subfamily)